ncbi:hypothetical protein V1512DRAFT_265537 [Lipomyces arxii]|uniref:uncharacterized protein n=1 Tax=Lipomyces arxii TaxID=56418 RepID=UPI0034CEDE26
MKLLYLFAIVYGLVFVSAWTPFHQHAPAYNTWDTKQITQWLHDNKIKYTHEQSRDDLLGLVRKNWNAVTASPGPFATWSDDRIINYLNQKGVDIADSAKDNRNWLLTTAHEAWEKSGFDTEETHTHIKDWIFDSWSDSALKRFLDEHQFGASAATTRDALLKKIKANYDHIAKNAKNAKSETQEASSWLFNAWSDSELADWLTSHGYDVPRNSDRNTLISLIKKYSYQASNQAVGAKNSAQAVFQKMNAEMLDTTGAVKDTVFDTWSESQLKLFLDKHGVPVPQPTKKDKLLALARKNKYYLKQDLEKSADLAASEAQGWYDYAKGKASDTKDAANTAAESATQYTSDTFKDVTNLWSNSRLQEFLRSRGIIAPEDSTSERLKDLVWKNRDAPIGTYDWWSFEAWSTEDLQNWLKESGAAVTGSRDDMAKKAGEYFDTIRNEGGDKYNAAVTKLQDWYSAGKDTAFDTWSDSDLKAYLDSYGVSTYQGTTRNELIAMARRNTYLFRHGANPEGWHDTYEKFKSGLWSAASGTKRASEKVQQQVAEGIKKLRHEL